MINGSMNMIERIFHKAKNHKEAETWDRLQQLQMTPEERQKVARDLKKRYYGMNSKDVRGKKQS